MKLENNDSKLLSEQDFAHKYGRLVATIAHKYYIDGGDYEDLAQEGMIGLLIAIRKYDDTRSKDFEAFAAMCVKRRIIDAVRRSSSKKGNIVITDLDSHIDYSDILDEHNPETQFLANETAKEMESALGGMLSQFESTVARLFLSGLSTAQISEKLAKPKKSVDNAIGRIRKKAEKLFKQE